jgi:hypothetical protein
MDSSEDSGRQRSIEDRSQLSERREKSGDYLGACDAALLGLEQHPEARELQYRAILNLSRAGAHKRARQLWTRYRLQPKLGQAAPDGMLEENIAALGARLDGDCMAPKERTASRPAAQRHFRIAWARGIAADRRTLTSDAEWTLAWDVAEHDDD